MTDEVPVEDAGGAARHRAHGPGRRSVGSTPAGLAGASGGHRRRDLPRRPLRRDLLARALIELGDARTARPRRAVNTRTRSSVTRTWARRWIERVY